MDPNLETRTDYQDVEAFSSPVRLVHKNARKNPLFNELVAGLKKPEEKKEFYNIFNQQVNDTYQNNPRIRRLIKSYDLGQKVEDLPVEQEDEARAALHQQAYAEPGRNYHYVNNFVGKAKTKKDILKKAGEAAKGIAKEAWPAIGLGAGWYVANKWAKNQANKGLIGRLGSSLAKDHWYQYLNPFETAKSATGYLAKESLRGMWGLIKKPTLYLATGYMLYKTIRYFLKKRREKMENNDIQRIEQLQRNVGLQNQTLYGMAA